MVAQKAELKACSTCFWHKRGQDDAGGRSPFAAGLGEVDLAIACAPAVEGVDEVTAIGGDEEDGTASGMVVEFGMEQGGGLLLGAGGSGADEVAGGVGDGEEETVEVSTAVFKDAAMPPAVLVGGEMLKVALAADADEFHFQIGNGGGVPGACGSHVGCEGRRLGGEAVRGNFEVHVLEDLPGDESAAVVEGERIEVHRAGDQS